MIRFPGSEPPPDVPAAPSTDLWRLAPYEPYEPPDPPRISASADRAAVTRRASETPILASGWQTNGPQVAAFEQEFAERLDARHAVAVSSGSAALELCLRTLGLPPGARVLVSTMAPNGVVQAIVRASLQPVLLDVSVHTGMPTTQDVHAAQRDRSRPSRAMVVEHWGGDTADVPALTEAGGLSPAVMIEDAGRALGASIGERPVGGSGTVCFSFYSTANLPVGDGGMVTTGDPERAALIALAREEGTSPLARRQVRQGFARVQLREGGLHSSLTEQSAATGRAQLQRLDRWQRRRQALAARYDAQLAGIPGVALPHRLPVGHGQHAWQTYPVRVDRTYGRDGVLRALAAAGIGTTHVAPPLHHLAYCRRVSELPVGGLPGADRFTEELISLPLYPRLTDAAVDRVSEVLEATLGGRSSRASTRPASPAVVP